MEKIFITGTGRCGTTFLIKLFTFLEFDTGYTKDNYTKDIASNCNSGMERFYNEKYYILKNPTFIQDIQKIIEDKSIIIKSVIIPIRDFKLSALSRVKYGTGKNGGLWCATDEQSQIQHYEKMMSSYIYYMTKYDINTIFIDFDKMIIDKQYLFDKIKYILDEKNISFDHFSTVYDDVSLTCKV
jgi:GTPase SAR1 family protein